MKVLLDTCVLFPTVLREILLAVAEENLFQPLWSARILEEWARATRKIGPSGELQARGEIALISARFPKASIRVNQRTEARLWLPDPNDIHVLAAAIDGNADVLITQNTKDFPRSDLFIEGIKRETPDAFLYDLWLANPDAIERAVTRVHAEAERLEGAPVDLRALLKRAQLYRTGKALA